ncbi:MAG: formate C-acetyltransferase [Chloroflexi bacterium]|nr:formate C-acetyltransferase [Chloroflexota bacterium]
MTTPILEKTFPFLKPTDHFDPQMIAGIAPRNQINPRIEKLRRALNVAKYPLCIEKARLVIEAYRAHEGDPPILRRAKATAHYLDHKTIFIEDGELIVGNVASKPMGMEAGSLGPTWLQEDLDDLKQTTFEISDEDETQLRALDEYWVGKNRTLEERMGQFYDDERLWPFIQSGILLPPWKKKNQGRGHGAAGVGWGLGLGQSLIVVDYAKVLYEGLNKTIADAEAELKTLRFNSADAIKKADFLNAVIITHTAIVRLANRFADLAEEMASRETDATRKKELEQIAETCRWVPANPARTFREAMQSFWLIWMMIAQGTAPGGRFDQFMFPFYKKDKADGCITEEQALELLICLRIKVMQFNFVGGGKAQREKWSGLARWHNWVIGGVTPDGDEATNDLSYLILEAAYRCRTPHHTITLRVHNGTPEPLLMKALELIRTGIGMPALVSDDSYIGYLVSQGVPLREARDYALAGCLDVNLPGKSRINAFGMFIAPLVLEITLNNGIEPRTGKQLGLPTGEFANFETFDDLLNAYKTQMKFFMGLAAEEHNILLQAQRELFPDAIHSALMVDAIKVGKDALDRAMPFENGSCMNVVGMINVADSLAAIKRLVFDEKKISARELKAALDANWEGYAAIHKLCLRAPKYGNGDPFVDSIAADLYKFWAETSATFPTIFGGTMKPAGISITSYGPGGALTGATPDGRYAGENLADGTMSAAQGRDMCGPTALIRSAMMIDQIPYQSTLFNMKFHPSALKGNEDLNKLASLIKTYFDYGGKQVQFNVVNRALLLNAQKHPEKHRDLVVRVAGYSAYFVQLSKRIQEDIIQRMEHEFA